MKTTAAYGTLSSYIKTSRGVVIEMLQSRGYDITLDDTLELEPIKLIQPGKSAIEVHYEVTKATISPKTIFNSDETKQTLIKQIIEDRSPDTAHLDFTLILILRDKTVPSVMTAIKSAMAQHNIFIQLFTIRSLMFNVTKHELVPVHERFTGDDLNILLNGEKGLLESLHIDTPRRLPHIKESDAVAMFIGLRPGEICKITRPSRSAGIHYVYRYCVSS
jgi:DNA-directed RNA polymerase subunit H (RpoH/RPB5)